MIVIKMKGRDSLLSIFEYPHGASLYIGHVPIQSNGDIDMRTPQFKTWADAVFATRELFEADKGLISINDYEPMEIDQ
jgi:hypothetical protein